MTAQILATFSGTLSGLLIGLAIITALEISFPRTVLTVRERAWGLLPWGVYIAIQSVFLTLFFAALVKAGIKPIFAGDIGSTIVAVVIAALIKDFLFYWFHRAEHRFLWRWHATHHAIERMTGINSYHHWSEILLNTIAVALPLYLLVDSVGPRNFVIGFILASQPIYLHSDTRLHFGKVGAWLADNRFHRIHHGRDLRYIDKNFGALTTIWDRMFGTAYLPDHDEWPEVGLAETAEPNTLWQWATWPWRHQSD